MMKLLGRGVGAALVAAIALFPRVTIAEEVSDEERMGEWDSEDGQRFGSVVIRGDLVATANAPSGWALVRTYENKSDEPAHCVVEERVMRTEAVWGARVMPQPDVVVLRTQKLDLKPHEKRSIGIYVADALGKQMTESHQILQGLLAQQEAGNFAGERAYYQFHVDYLRPLAKGETRARPEGPSGPELEPPPPMPAKPIGEVAGL